MPLPSRKSGEKKDAFVSRCVRFMTEKGEGESQAQRVAICMSRANYFTDEELNALANLMGDPSEYSYGYEVVLAGKDSPPDGHKLNKPFRTPKGPKKFSVYVKNDKGNIVKVNFGDPNMEIKRDDPGRRKNFRARHNCDSPGPKWKARYWSCKFWEKGNPVSKLTSSHVLYMSVVMDHTHTLECGELEGETSNNHGHTHKWKMNPDGSYVTDIVNGHSHMISAPKAEALQKGKPGKNDPRKTPAEPKERKRGSKKNDPGSAKKPNKNIVLSESTVKSLQTRMEKHNGGKPKHRATLAALKTVYRRGAGAFSTSHHPKMDRHGWAMARVAAFLYLLKNERPSNPNYKQDNDLLPKGHPRSSK